MNAHGDGLVRVWAPDARAVTLDRGGAPGAMHADAGGWWVADVRLAHGDEYRFVVDGRGPFPDPRSRWQPHGVHGPSRWVEHERFAWRDAGWRPPPLASGVVYELHVGTFTAQGDFDAVAGKLGHLKALGVTHVELMPVAEFPGVRGWGYDGVDLYAPHHAYGGPDALKRLIDACHAQQLAVLLDVVYNHLGPDGNYLAQFGPYFTDRYRTPWGAAMNLDGPGSDEVRRFCIDNALMWLRDYHVDGLRVDAVHAIFDMSARHFLEQLGAEVHALGRALGRDLVVIAESDLNDPRLVRGVEAGGYGLDAQWSDDVHHALHGVLTGERDGYYADFGRIADISSALTRGYVYDGCYSAFRQRRHGGDASRIPKQRFVACLQNHDQVGNRAQGDRIGHRVDVARLKIGAALVLGGPFVPLVFQGEEWNASAPFQYFTDHQDAQLASAVREGRRAEFAAFGWDPAAIPDPQARETFSRSVLDWSEPQRASHAGLLAWYRRLIALRRAEPELAAGAPVAVRYDEAARWLVCERGSISIACNFAGASQRIPLRAAARHDVLEASQPGVEAGTSHADVPAATTVILRSAAGP